jgi:SAM-dependent methyltransferase
MINDILILNKFYSSILGQVARRLIRRQLRALWPDVHDKKILGLGYATPFLRPFVGEARLSIAVMSARLGAVQWPYYGRKLVALAEETNLPLADLSVDRVLLVHGLEITEDVTGLMREIWRVLADGGELLIVVPNRQGIWAQIDRTPFGQGRPYSILQLSATLTDMLFVPKRVARALYFPPISSPFLLTTAPAWEKIGSRWFPAFSGILMIEASKQIYQATLVKQYTPSSQDALAPAGSVTL